MRALPPDFDPISLAGSASSPNIVLQDLLLYIPCPVIGFRASSVRNAQFRFPFLSAMLGSKEWHMPSSREYIYRRDGGSGWGGSGSRSGSGAAAFPRSVVGDLPLLA
jgi:hypothetical protein